MKTPDFVNMSEMVKSAYDIACRAHEGATDKAGKSYILHPIAVASELVEYGEKYVSVGLMHDVIEDTDVEISDIANIFPEDVVEALSLLTHESIKGTREEYLKSYWEYVNKINDSGNDIAIKVKIADLHNNMDIRRIPNPQETDYRRIEEKYKPALQLLTRKLD